MTIISLDLFNSNYPNSKLFEGKSEVLEEINRNINIISKYQKYIADIIHNTLFVFDKKVKPLDKNKFLQKKYKVIYAIYDFQISFLKMIEKKILLEKINSQTSTVNQAKTPNRISKSVPKVNQAKIHSRISPSIQQKYNNNMQNYVLFPKSKTKNNPESNKHKVDVEFKNSHQKKYQQSKMDASRQNKQSIQRSSKI